MSHIILGIVCVVTFICWVESD